MLNWFAKKNPEPDGPARDHLMEMRDIGMLLGQETAVLFKHSRTCPVSFAARHEVRRFAAKCSGIPVFAITVQSQRALSNEIEERTGIRHETPQVIVFRKGTAVGSASHEDVTAEYLQTQIL